MHPERHWPPTGPSGLPGLSANLHAPDPADPPAMAQAAALPVARYLPQRETVDYATAGKLAGPQRHRAGARRATRQRVHAGSTSRWMEAAGTRRAASIQHPAGGGDAWSGTTGPSVRLAASATKSAGA
jgi:hypothetical protein